MSTKADLDNAISELSGQISARLAPVLAQVRQAGFDAGVASVTAPTDYSPEIAQLGAVATVVADSIIVNPVFPQTATPETKTL